MADNIAGQRLAFITVAFISILLGFGSVLFHSLENWTWIESFYFTVVTVTTVGYGDIAPTSDETRLAAALYILFGVVIGAGIVRFLIGAIVKSQAQSRMNRRAKSEEKED